MISDEARQLLLELHHLSPAGGDLSGARRRLRRLGQLQELTVLPAVLPLALDPALSTDVMATLESLLEGRGAAEVCRLDGVVRASLDVGGQILADWENLSLGRLQELAAIPGGEWLVAAVCSHRNGRLREWAVRRLAESMHTGPEIAYLVTRLNDWVGPVRQAAATALETRLTDSFGAYFVECLPFLDRIPGRPDQLTWLRRIRSFVSRPALLEPALGSSDRELRLSAWRASEPGESLLRRALKDSDQVIQAWATRQLAQIELSPAFLEELLGHPRAAVRRAGILCSPGLAPERLPLLLDKSPRVRAAAQACFAQLDLAEFYRQHLPQKAALAGLGETGKAEDASLLLPFCRCSRDAVRALARLDRDAHLEELMDLLASPQPGLAKEVYRALLPAAGRLSQPLRQLAGDGLAPAHSRLLALDLLERGDKWESLPLLLELRRLPGASALLARWWQHYNRRQIPPKPQQLQRAQQALEGLETQELPELRKLLRSFG
ncbi:MAG: hypothetical protein KIS61_01815 [Candidatus Eremiobacteraeota bacterium]|nr:hypothetical protein [Candidatus Eremiobacteraeota bacterium]